MIELINIGSSLNYPERPIDDTYSNTHGLGDWAFMHFTTPFQVETPMGRLERSSDEFLINSPDYPQWHKGVGVCFKNDWFVFNGSRIREYMDSCKLPVNIPFSLVNSEIVISLFCDIQREKIVRDTFWNEKIDLLIRQLFLELGRGLSKNDDIFLSEREKELLPLFQEARVKIHQSSGKNWKVRDMADLVSLSENRFTILYKKFFQQSPVNDLLETKLNMVKARLLNHTTKIEIIAEECGFKSVHYLWRMFKKNFGISPSEFRKPSKTTN